MQTDRQLTLSFSILLGLQVVTALAAITLFGRMAPAIEGIIEDNVVSVEAVESMLAATLEAQLDENGLGPRRSFELAFATARANVTEADEIPVLDNVQELAPLAFAGDRDSVTRLLSELRSLGSINRDAMTSADRSAKRLGVAGAWSMVVLGALGFAAGLMTLRRLRKRLLVPIREINAVLRSAVSGDHLRRCTPSLAPAGDFAETMLMINQILDRILAEECSTLPDRVMPPIAETVSVLRNR